MRDQDPRVWPDDLKDKDGNLSALAGQPNPAGSATYSPAQRALGSQEAGAQDTRSTDWFDNLERDPQIDINDFKGLTGGGGPPGQTVSFSSTINKIEGYDDDALQRKNAIKNWGDSTQYDKVINPDHAVIHNTGCEHDRCWKQGKYASPQAYAESWVAKNKGIPFLIDENGRIYQTQKITQRGRHTGIIKPKDRTEYGARRGISNDNSIGIELDAPSDAHVTPEQIRSAIMLLKFLGIDAKNIVGHGEIKIGRDNEAGQSVLQQIRGGPENSRKDMGMGGVWSYEEDRAGKKVSGYRSDNKFTPQMDWMGPFEK